MVKTTWFMISGGLAAILLAGPGAETAKADFYLSVGVGSSRGYCAPRPVYVAPPRYTTSYRSYSHSGYCGPSSYTRVYRSTCSPVAPRYYGSSCGTYYRPPVRHVRRHTRRVYYVEPRTRSYHGRSVHYSRPRFDRYRTRHHYAPHRRFCR